MAKSASKTAQPSPGPSPKGGGRKAPATVKTIAEVAKRLKVDPTTVKGWFAQGCPKQPGRYDVAAIARWRAEHKKPRGSVAGDLGERARWEMVKTRAEAKLRQLALRAKRSELILVSVVAQIVRRHVAEVVMQLRQLPDCAVAGEQLPRAVKQSIRERIRAKVRAMQITLEKSVRETAEAGASGESGE